MVHSLAPETLFHILELANGSCDSVRLRNAVLSSAALVCRRWWGIAQELLWRDVELSLVECARAFEAVVGDVELRTDRLKLVSLPKNLRMLGGQDLERVIRACKGLEVLELQDVRELDIQCLAGPKMAGECPIQFLAARLVHTLPPDLSSRTVDNSDFVNSQFFPPESDFQLSHLFISVGKSYAESWTSPLLCLLLRPSITSLHLDLHPKYYRELATLSRSLLPTLKIIAPHLRELKLTSDIPFLDDAASFLRLCTQLEDFSAGALSLFDHLSLPLKSWTCPGSLSASEVLQVLQSETLAVSELEEVSFLWSDEAREIDVFRQVFEECQRREIMVQFADERFKSKGFLAMYGLRLGVRTLLRCSLEEQAC